MHFHLFNSSRILTRHLPFCQKTSLSQRLNSSQTSIRKVLIANRGEIACRVIRTAKKMGIQSVAVYSDADKLSLHVGMADEAYHIGPPAPQESYLRGDKVMEAAKASGADAIHPGYGFLSESTEFADSCEQNNIIFIGPPASAIRDMGIKSTSKYIMSKADVPIIEGYHGEDQRPEKLLEEAKNIRFPVMIKAVRGGGGKGMRIAMTESEFMSQLSSAKTEAMKSFGDDVMLVEKYVQRPRHVEVQVFGDKHDNYVYLFERDCSVQRRHQKIIEEAPAPGILSGVREKLGDAAVRAARAVKYVGAGTVEFILDSSFDFYFMEMNTRLQVEHPVTEMITGTDLVEWQIRVAAGEHLPISQEKLRINGHSFEARIYAEDPSSNFMPGAGTLKRLITPKESMDVRIETGVREGDEVSVHYDPMIAKLVVWGKDRPTALLKLSAALSQFNVVGLNTNVKFLQSLAGHPQFEAGEVHTDFIPEHESELFPQITMPITQICQATLALILLNEQEGIRKAIHSEDPTSPFRPGVVPRFNHRLMQTVSLQHEKKNYEIPVVYLGKGAYKITIEGIERQLEGRIQRVDGVDELVTSIDRTLFSTRVIKETDELHLFTPTGHFSFTLPLPKFKESSIGSSTGQQGVAPMPGVVEKVCVEVGQVVRQGDPLMVMIAMKMEYVIKASSNGVVEKVLHNAGDNVAKGTSLVKIKEGNQ